MGGLNPLPLPASGNPVLDQVDQLHPAAQQALAQAGQQLYHTPSPTQMQPALGGVGTPVPGTPAAQPTAQHAPLAQSGQAQPLGPPSNLAADKAELQRLHETGTGASQVHNPFLRGLAVAGDAALSGFFPRVAASIPGTTAHHNNLVAQQQQAVTGDEALESEQAKNAEVGAQTKNLESMPALHQAQLLNAQTKLGQGQTALDIKEQQQGTREEHERNALHEHGFDMDPEGNVVPLSYDKLSAPQQAIHDLKGAQEELASANAAYKKAQKDNIPSQMAMAQQRIQTAQANAATARGRLGLQREEFNANFMGQGPGGEDLPGAAHEQSTGHAIGPRVANSNKPTTATRSAMERAGTMSDLEGRIRQGLADPEIRNYLGPMRGRLSELQNTAGVLPSKVAQFKNDLVSYGAFQAGLHPVRGIGAMQYFDKVMGGLGQTPEELEGKLNSNRATGNSVINIGQGKKVQPTPEAGGKGPAVGAVEGGYRFKGGDPSKQSSWEKVQ